MKTPKDGHWSKIAGLFSKQIYWTLFWAEKLSGRNNELIHVVLRGSNVVVLPD